MEQQTTTSAGMASVTTILTWRERLGFEPDFPLHAATNVERAMVAEIAELRAVATAAPAPVRLAATTPATLAVLGERQRQQREEGWTLAHDDAYQGEELRWAAVCYALYMKQHNPPAFWPWPPEWWKPCDRRANLVRAAALLIAEIERIDRAALAPSASLTTVDCPACNGKEACDECHGQGKVIVSRAEDQLAATTTTDSSAPPAPAGQIKHGDVPSIEITLRQAKELVDCFGGHDAEVSIIQRPAAWGDMPDGLYAYFSEYPDEGSMYLGPTEVDDDLAMNGDASAQASQAAASEVRNAALEEAAALAVEWGNARLDDHGGHALRNYAEAVRALRTNPATPASKGDAS